MKNYTTTPFFKLIHVWVIIVTIVTTSFSLVFWIRWSNTISFCDTVECFNNAIVIFKLPIAVLGLLIPILAILATNHRSAQTAEQIKSSNSQNNFVNHHKNMEMFEAFIENKVNHGEFNFNNITPVTSPRDLYIKIYPQSIDGYIYVYSSHLLLESTQTLDEIRKILSRNTPKDLADIVSQESLFSHVDKDSQKSVFDYVDKESLELLFNCLEEMSKWMRIHQWYLTLKQRNNPLFVKGKISEDLIKIIEVIGMIFSFSPTGTSTEDYQSDRFLELAYAIKSHNKKATKPNKT